MQLEFIVWLPVEVQTTKKCKSLNLFRLSKCRKNRKSLSNRHMFKVSNLITELFYGSFEDVVVHQDNFSWLKTIVYLFIEFSCLPDSVLKLKYGFVF